MSRKCPTCETEFQVYNNFKKRDDGFIQGDLPSPCCACDHRDEWARTNIPNGVCFECEHWKVEVTP